MKKLSLLLLSITLITSCSSTAPVHFYSGQPRSTQTIAHLSVPGPITILRIDGREIDVPLIEDGLYDIYLLPGRHRIDFKYELFWGDTISGHLVKSDIVSVISDFQAGKSYELTYIEPQDEEDAFDLGQNFKAWLKEKGSDYRIVSVSEHELNAQVSTQQPKLTTQPAIQSPAPPPVVKPEIATNTVADSSGVSIPAGIDAETAVNEDAFKRLKFWWLMADEQERKQFIEWLNAIQAVESADK